MGQLANEWMRLAVMHAWQVTALIVLTAVVIRLFAHNRPHLAFVLWLLVLLKCVTPPVWSSPSSVFSWLQPSQVAATAEPQQQPDNAEDSEQPGFGAVTVVARSDRSPVPVREWQSLTPRPLDLETETPVATGTAGHPSPVNRVSSIERILIVLLVTWLLGAALIVAVAAIRYLGFCWRTKRHGCGQESRLTDLVRDLSHRLKVKRKVRLRVSTGRVGPAVIGVLRPTVLLPAVLVKGRSNEELKPLLAHELIHVRRGDLWIGMLQVIAQALWWCHPLVWWAGRRTSREAERCCDEEVVAELGCSPARYARSLLGVLELKKTLKPVPAFPGVRPVEVTSNRLERIMKLGHGCRRRTPWWCWIVLVAAGAGMLPGAAFLAAEKGEPIRILTSPQGRHVASIPALPRHVAEEPLVTRIYEVADLVDKAQVELDIDVERAKLAVIDHIGGLGYVPGPERKTSDSMSDGDVAASEETEQESPKQKQRPSCGWFEHKLIVRETAARHERIASTLAVLRKHGFGQVTIEARLLTGPEEVINAIGSNWTVITAEVPDDERPTHQDPENPLRAVRQSMGLRDSSDLPLPDQPTEQRARAQTVVEKRLPVMLEVMDDRRASKVIEQLDDDARVNVLAAPKVVTFNGQSAEISCCSQRPFVVGIKDGEPQIRIVDEGLRMRLCPIAGKDAMIRLQVGLTLSTIRDVETTTIPRRKGRPGATLQVPVVAKTQLDINVVAQSGSTTVIGGLKATDDKGKEQSVLVMLRPTALAPQVAGAPNGRKMSGAGVNSDAGVTGTITIDAETTAANRSPDAKTLAEPPAASPAPRPIVAAHSCEGVGPPSDEEVISALDIKRNLKGALWEAFKKYRKDIRIVKDKNSDYVDPPRSVPLIGPGQLHHTHYKCSVYFTESSDVDWPIPVESDKDAHAVVYVETCHFHTLDGTRAKPDLHSSSNASRSVSQKDQATVSPNQENPPFYTRAYNVADLVIPVPDFFPAPSTGAQGTTVRRTVADFETQIELITSTIAPSTWDRVGGHGSIAEFPRTLSLFVTQTEDVHEQIADLLKQLRRLQDVQVTVSLKTVRVAGDKDVADLELSESSGGSTMPADAAADLLRSIGGEDRRDMVVAAPKMTLFNGQKVSLRLSPAESEKMNGVGAFHIQPVVSDDRKAVRLTFVVEHREAKGEASKGTTKAVPIGESLVVDVTGHLDAPQRNDNSGERVLVVLTPQIIVNEPEEAANGDVLRAVRR